MGQLKFNISDIEFYPLKVFENENGKLFHHVKSISPYFEKFGEVYYSLTYPGVVKGWKLHKENSQIFTVPHGNMKFVFLDLRENSSSYKKFDEVIIGEGNYGALKVPFGIWYAFSPQGKKEALIANVISHPHDPAESVTEPLDKFLNEHNSRFWGLND